ncbi:MAG: UTRA domain-containing protein [Streptosporangiaceae bacterium]
MPAASEGGGHALGGPARPLAAGLRGLAGAGGLPAENASAAPDHPGPAVTGTGDRSAGNSGAESHPVGEAARPAVQVLADRLAAALVHHEPGWRLPRHTALARRYNVSTAQLEAAISELVQRHLIRRLPDGQLYRISPAEYLISLEGSAGLSSRLDPMGGELSCRSRQVSWRRVPEDIGWALQVDPAEQVCVIRVLWTAGGEPAAYATTYLPGDLAGQAVLDDGPASVPAFLPLTAGQAEQPGGQVPAGTPAALHLEMQPPPPSVARSLRLSAGQAAAIVTIRFDDPASRPAALTVAVLRPDLFRLVIQAGSQPPPGPAASAGAAAAGVTAGQDGSFAGAWTHAVEDWES